jgi:hypothetical protein
MNQVHKIQCDKTPFLFQIRAECALQRFTTEKSFFSEYTTVCQQLLFSSELGKLAICRVSNRHDKDLKTLSKHMNSAKVLKSTWETHIFDRKPKILDKCYILGKLEGLVAIVTL